VANVKAISEDAKKELAVIEVISRRICAHSNADGYRFQKTEDHLTTATNTMLSTVKAKLLSSQQAVQAKITEVFTAIANAIAAFIQHQEKHPRSSRKVGIKSWVRP